MPSQGTGAPSLAVYEDSRVEEERRWYDGGLPHVDNTELEKLRELLMHTSVCYVDTLLRSDHWLSNRKQTRAVAGRSVVHVEVLERMCSADAQT